MESVDHIYWINLDYRTDRFFQMEDWMNEAGIPRGKITRINGIHIYGRGIVGCCKSHIKAIETFLESNHRNCIIFEDDYLPLDVPSFGSHFQRLADSGISYDCVLLSYNNLNSKELEGTPWLHKVNQSYTTSGYLITREFATRLLANFKEGLEKLEEGYEKCGKKLHEYCLDIYWSRLMRESNFYCFYPRLGIQREGFSDIELINVKYNA
jgi:GR25 family glycosyltransferase involved in LPS biosynthesis